LKLTKSGGVHVPSQQHNKIQTPRPSIADQCNTMHSGDRPENLVIEIDSLADMVSRIVGAKIGGANIPITSADELAKLLADIREELPEIPATKNVINTLDAAIELAFLHTPVYQDAFKIYKLDLTGRMYNATSAYEVMRETLLSVSRSKAKAKSDE
jgi:hypothetical protein